MHVLFILVTSLFLTLAKCEEKFPVPEDYSVPRPLNPHRIYLADHFDNVANFEKRWIKSEAKKEGIDEEIAKYDGEWVVEASMKDALGGDLGLVLKSKAKHAAISTSLLKPFVFDKLPLVVQYEVTFQEGQDCGGAYLKLLSQGGDLSLFTDKTPYSIMFGPDKCGNDMKLHFIFKHKNLKNGTVEEKHCSKPKERLEEFFTDKLPHLYTLILNPDNTFEIEVDEKQVHQGSLLEDFTPSVNPPAEIDDLNDTKPVEWDERERFPDPDAVKPEDWNEDAPAQIVDESATMPEGWMHWEPKTIPDKEAVKPADWDKSIDGEWEPPELDNPACEGAVGCGTWEPPMINNPEFKGKWRPPLIDNPNYKGKWRPRKIPNPDYFEDKTPFKMAPVAAIGFELWSMSSNIYFDNLVITDDLNEARAWASKSYHVKREKINKESESVVQKLARLTNEYPWLWGVYIVILAIPVVFILYLCCKPGSSASQEKEELRQAAEHKKTDKPPLTDEIGSGDADAEALVKDDENVEVEEDDRERNSGPDSDDEEEEEVEEDEEKDKEKVEEEISPKSGTRKRKPRKE